MEAQKQAADTFPLYQSHSPDEKVEILFRKYYPSLCKSLYRILKDSSLAEDIVQEVFLKVWDKRESLELNEAIQAYLYRSCYHAALNLLKKQQPLHALPSLTVEVCSDEDTAKTLHFLETEQIILAAIEKLPPQTKRVFSLSRFEELSYKEIAQKLDISLKSVEKHISIALQRLREQLKEHLSTLLLILLSQLF